MIEPQMQPSDSSSAAASRTAAVSIRNRRRASRWAKAGVRSRFPPGTSAMPRQRPPRAWNTCQSARWAGWFPSRVTQRG